LSHELFSFTEISGEIKRETRIKAVGLDELYFNPVNLDFLIWSYRKKFTKKKSVSARNC